MAKENKVKETEAKPTSDSSKKKSSGLPVILIIVGVIVVLCLGCSVVGFVIYNKAKEKAEDAISNGLKNSLEDTIEDSINDGSDDDSEFSFGGKLPSNFPSDVPIYQDSEIGISSSSTDESGEHTVVYFEVDDKSQDVIDFYKGKLTSKGWKIVGEFNIIGLSIQAKKDNSEIFVNAFDDNGKTTYTLTITKN